MKTVFFNILLLFVLNSFSIATYNDTIATKLHGQGCGIIPNSEEVDYNITLLEKLQKTDSNNVLIYKHLAMQYYILWSREKDNILKEKNRQTSIRNNIKVLDFHLFGKTFKTGTINNLLILYSSATDCQNVKKYYSLLKKKDLKSIDKGTIDYVKKSCDIE
jgi:hypothetical protein